jgi:FkbM family methyltransferase
MRLVERVLRHGDLVIDVGANIGLYTIFAAEKGAEVIALEPGDTSELVRNLRLNRLEAEVIQVAVSREDGVGLFTVGRDQEDRVIVDSAATEPGTTKEVRLVALDSVLDGRTARLVKIDVEGNERLVVEGMVRTLADKRAEVLLLEWNDSSLAALGENREPVASLLLAAGYSLFRPDNQGRLVPENSPAPSDVDVVALSPSALLEFEALIVGTR